MIRGSASPASLSSRLLRSRKLAERSIALAPPHNTHFRTLSHARSKRRGKNEAFPSFCREQIESIFTTMTCVKTRVWEEEENGGEGVKRKVKFA